MAFLLVRSLHTLSRRWLVLVPAGVTVVDPLTLVEPVLVRREEHRADRTRCPARPLSADVLDLRLGTIAGGIEVDLAAPVPFARRRGRAGAQLVEPPAVVVALARPGAFLDARRGAPHQDSLNPRTSSSTITSRASGRERTELHVAEHEPVDVARVQTPRGELAEHRVLRIRVRQFGHRRAVVRSAADGFDAHALDASPARPAHSGSPAIDAGARAASDVDVAEHDVAQHARAARPPGRGPRAPRRSEIGPRV